LANDAFGINRRLRRSFHCRGVKNKDTEYSGGHQEYKY